MIKKFTFFIFLWFTGLMAFSQEAVKYRVILIGDAGEMNPLQMDALKNAANHVIPQKTSVVFLGDNIYPKGMGLPGSKEEEAGKSILQSQFTPMRKMGAAVYFVPGNHDWDKSGPDGLAKIKQQGDYLKSQNDSLLKLVPANGCPDPVAIQLTDQLTIIAFDSEWWLFPYNKQNTIADCDCSTKDEVTARMQDLLNENQGKVILLASHHPFQSYGAHGGYFTLKDHLFPLTAINRKLYIPLPVIGSAYPILRTTLLSPEDLKHPLYKDMIRSVNSVFGNYPNATYVAGHEHGLQLIKGDQFQVVSGAGAKSTPNKLGKNALFHESKQGYVIADQLQNNDMRYEYYTYTDSGVQKVFTYTKPYVKVALAAENKIAPLKADSIVIKIKPSYDSVGHLYR